MNKQPSESKRGFGRSPQLALSLVLALAAVAFGFAPAASAATCTPGTNKCFAADISPHNVTGGPNVVFSVTMTNEAPSTTTQQLGSVNLTAPLTPAPGITVTSVDLPICPVPLDTSPTCATVVSNVVQVRNIGLQPQQSTSFTLHANVPTPCATYTWSIAGKQSNNFNGTNNAVTLDTANSNLVTSVSCLPSDDIAASFGGQVGATTYPADTPDPATASNPSAVNRVLYTMTVTNNSATVAATNVTLDSTLSGTAGSQFSQIPAQGLGSGVGWSCDPGTLTSKQCHLAGSLAPGGTSVIQAWVQTPPSAGSIVNAISVSATQPDPNTANNSAAETTTVKLGATCAPTDVSCASAFIVFSQPSSATSGATANTAQWLVATINFPGVTGATGGTVYNMHAISNPETICVFGGSTVLCDFENVIDTINNVYAGASITMSMECDQSHCPRSLAGSITVVKKGDNGQVSVVSPCGSGFCFSVSVDPANGNLVITIHNVPVGDPSYAGVCLPPHTCGSGS